MNKQYRLGLIMLTFPLLSMIGCEAAPKSPLADLVVAPATADELGYSIAWQVDLLLPSDARLLDVEPMGDRVAALASDRVVSVLDAENGNVLWHARIGESISRLLPPVREDELLIASTRSRAYVYHIDRGELLNTIALEHIASTRPIVLYGNAFYGAADGVVFAQNLTTGAVLWEYEMGSPVSTAPILSSSTLIATSQAGDIAALVTTTGTLLWKKSTWEAVSAQPVATAQTVYVPGEDQALYAFDRATGELKWRYLTQASLTQDPALMGQLLILPVPGHGVLAINAANGELVWRLDRELSPITRRGDRILMYASTLQPRIVYVSAASGEVLREVLVPRVENVLAAETQQALYFVDTGGRIMKVIPD